MSCSALGVAVTLAVASTTDSLVTVNITIRADSCRGALADVGATACEMQMGASASPDARASLQACSAASESPASSRATESAGGSEDGECLETDGRSPSVSLPAPESPSGPGSFAVTEVVAQVLGESQVPPRGCEVDVMEVMQTAPECAAPIEVLDVLPEGDCVEVMQTAPGCAAPIEVLDVPPEGDCVEVMQTAPGCAAPIEVLDVPPEGDCVEVMQTAPECAAPIAVLDVVEESTLVKVMQPAAECALQIAVHAAERASTIGSVKADAPTATLGLDCTPVADAPPQDEAVPFVSKVFFDMSDEKLIRRTPKSKKIPSYMKRKNKKDKSEDSETSEKSGKEGPLRMGGM